MTDERMTEILGFQKEHLQVNWTEDDDLITRKIKRSMRYLQDKVGSALKFEDDSPELELVFERVRYDWNNALDDFETNYKHDLLSLIMTKAVEAHGADSGDV